MVECEKCRASAEQAKAEGKLGYTICESCAARADDERRMTNLVAGMADAADEFASRLRSLARKFAR